MPYQLNDYKVVITELKEGFFKSDDLKYQLRRSQESDRFGNCLFFYAIIEDKFMDSLLQVASENLFVHSMLNFNCFLKSDIEKLRLDLQRIYNDQVGVFEQITKSVDNPDYHLVSMLKLFEDLYLIYRSRSRITTEEEENYVKKLLANVDVNNLFKGML
jgi:hypothetical protein